MASKRRAPALRENERLDRAELELCAPPAATGLLPWLLWSKLPAPLLLRGGGGQRNLAGRHQVRNKIANLLFFQLLQQALRHQRESCLSYLDDFLAIHDQTLSGSLQGDSPFVLRYHQRAQDPVVFEFDL